MTKEIVLLDLFSGIGGFAKGIEDAGFIIKKHLFSEIDKHAIANYYYNFKNSKYVGPIESIDRVALGKVDIIAFGSPCQDFSIAGQRAGLDGKRSSLILEAIKIIVAKKPSIFIWENVKGTFSSNNGEDFFAILQEFANIGGYHIEWQLLNTLWVLPQNRERIYLVGHFTESLGSFKPIFPFTKNDRLFNGPKRTTKRQSQAQHSGTVTNGKLRADDTFVKTSSINADYYGKEQQNRIYHTDGAIGCLSKNRLDDKAKIKVVALRDRNGTKNYEVQENDATNTLTSVHKDNILVLSTQPRTGDLKKEGTGFISTENETYCLDTANSIAIETKSDEYRRLTEIECERLQGFPDNWTQFGIYDGINKPIAQTNRYKLIGNAVTTTLPKMIAQKLIENYL